MRRRVVLLGLAGRVECLAEVPRPVAASDELRVERVVQLPGQHLLRVRCALGVSFREAVSLAVALR